MRHFRRSPRLPHRAILLVALAVLLHVAAGAAPLGGAAGRRNEPAAGAAGRLSHWRRGVPEVQVLDPLLESRILHLRATAPTFDQAWREMVASEVPVVIGTREQLEEHLPRFVRSSNGWAGITVSWGEGGAALSRSAVAIRVGWLRELHERYGNPDSTFVAALDRLLIHEVYGHLVPVVERGSAEYRCADPAPHQRLSESCAGRRELALRAERDSVIAALAAQSLSSSWSW